MPETRGRDGEARPVNGLGLPRYFLRGLTVQMTNPKALLAWIAIMSLGLQADAPLIVAVVIVIGTTTFSFVFHTIYALAFSSQPMIRLYAPAPYEQGSSVSHLVQETYADVLTGLMVPADFGPDFSYVDTLALAIMADLGYATDPTAIPATPGQ